MISLLSAHFATFEHTQLGKISVCCFLARFLLCSVWEAATSSSNNFFLLFVMRKHTSQRSIECVKKKMRGKKTASSERTSRLIWNDWDEEKRRERAHQQAKKKTKMIKTEKEQEKKVVASRLKWFQCSINIFFLLFKRHTMFTEKC